jgi:hypothetical protein
MFLVYVHTFIPDEFCTSSNAFNALILSQIQGVISSRRASIFSFHFPVMFQIVESALSLIVPSLLYIDFLTCLKNSFSGQY